MSLHDIGRKRSSPGIVLDTLTGAYAQQLCYVYNENYYDLGKAIDAVHTFDEFVQSNVIIEIYGEPYDPRDHFAAMRVEVQSRTRNQTG